MEGQGRGSQRGLPIRFLDGCIVRIRRHAQRVIVLAVSSCEGCAELRAGAEHYQQPRDMPSTHLTALACVFCRLQLDEASS